MPTKSIGAFANTSPTDTGTVAPYPLDYLTSLVENTRDAIWSVDRDRRFAVFNPFLRDRIFEWWGVNIAIGMRHGGRSGEDAKFWDDAYARAFAGERVLAEAEYHNAAGDSFVEFSLDPIRDQHGIVTGVAGLGRDVTHIHQLNAEILKRETEFGQILDSTGDAIWSVDAEYRLTVFNSSFQRILLASVDKEITVGMSYLEFADGHEAEFWKEAYDRAFQGEQFMIEREYKNPAGHAIIDFSFSPIWQNGGIVGVAGIGRNVMRLHEIQWALERSEQSYRQLFEDSPLPMWTVDLESLRFFQVNRAAMKMYGYSEAEFRELTILDVRPAQDRNHFEETTLKAIRKDRRDRHEQSQHIRKNGKVLDVEIFSHYIEINGRPSRLTLIKDITKQRQAEADLIRANERFRLAAEAVTAIVWDWNVVDDQVECFSSLEHILGFDPFAEGPQPIRCWLERIHPEDRWQAARGFFQAIRDKSHFEGEYRVRRLDGQYTYVWSNSTMVLNEAGRLIRVVGSIVDITERKQMELALKAEHEAAIIARDRAEEMSRLKSSFMANMSHEIRTPMTASLGFAELLHDEMIDPEKKAQAGIIQSSGNRLLATINQILDLARIEAGKTELHPAPHLLRDTVYECVAALLPLAEAKGLRLEITEHSREIRATFDLIHLNRILTNLIGNAIKFTPSGEIRISLWRCDTPEEATLYYPREDYPAGEFHQLGTMPYPAFAVEVRDEGIGISKEFLPHIFDEFKQESAGYNRTYEGTGLGLTISAKLVELMHGSITVTSELGKGSRFIVSLPME